MEEQILDASEIDGLDGFNLTGDYEDISDPEQEIENTTENTTENIPQNTPDNTPDNTIENTPDNSSQSDENGNKIDQNETTEDFINQLLTLKGIKDPTKIKFEDESGAIVERNWEDLSKNERLNILVNEEDPEKDLDEEEILLINYLRENQLTPQQYVEAIQQQAAMMAMEKYQQTQVPTYEIDSLSDDELFALDLLEKVGEENITDEELQEALEQAKSNEALYAKQIEGLRTVYKNLEDQQKYDAEQAQIAQAEQQYQEFSNKVLNEISSFNSFANQEIELSTDDKNDIANYMLTRRDTGISDFYKDMQDPATATLAAFWLLRGPEILNEMETQIRAAYQRGFSVGKTQLTNHVTPKTPQVVVQPKQVNSTSNLDIQSAFGLEDDSYLN